jgi:hypothetical protein
MSRALSDTAEGRKVASVRKSILGMLFGNDIAREPRPLHATVKQDLWMARSGFYWEYADRDGPRKGTIAPSSTTTSGTTTPLASRL